MTHTSCLILIHMIQHMGILLLYLLWSPIKTFKGTHPTHIHQYTHSTHNPSLFANCNVYYPMHRHLMSSPNLSVHLATRDITDTTTIQMLGIITTMEIRKKVHPTHIHQCTHLTHNPSFITMCTIHTGILFWVLLMYTPTDTQSVYHHNMYDPTSARYPFSGPSISFNSRWGNVTITTISNVGNNNSSNTYCKWCVLRLWMVCDIWVFQSFLLITGGDWMIPDKLCLFFFLVAQFVSIAAPLTI